MEITNEVALDVPLAEAWPLLTDLGRVAPLMPGVRVDAADADGIDAQMRVKVGPVTAAYAMRVTTESLDADRHTAILRASGRELRGHGSVEATVTAALAPDGDRTAVRLQTAVDVTGRVAQMGGGVMKDVADRLLGQFAERLAAEVAAGPGAGEAAPDAPPVDVPPVDLGRAAGAALAPRLVAPGLVVAAAAVLLALVVRRRDRDA